VPRPIIAVTSWRHHRGAAEGEHQWTDICCGDGYVRAVAAAGAAPLILPRVPHLEAVHDAMAVADGLLLTGGGDVQAALYGAAPHPRSRRQDPVRDEVEIEAIRVAEQRHLPVLGICRGIQLLNVVAGGTLVHDIPTEIPGAIQHRTEADGDYLGHAIEIERGSLLHRLLGADRLATNSWHHQAVKDPGKGLRVTARTADGVVEAIESADGRILAVQCHPEMSFDRYPVFLELFRWLARQASSRSESPPASR